MNKKKTQPLKIEKPNILKKAELVSMQTESKKVMGRPKTPVEDRLSESIRLLFTPKEKEVIVKKAGDVPLATFIKNYIKRNTDLIE